MRYVAYSSLRDSNLDNICIIYFFPGRFTLVLPLDWKNQIHKLKFKYFQVIAAFLARRYRNQLDPQEKAARAIFPQHDYAYWCGDAFATKWLLFLFFLCNWRNTLIESQEDRNVNHFIKIKFLIAWRCYVISCHFLKAEIFKYFLNVATVLYS